MYVVNWRKKMYLQVKVEPLPTVRSRSKHNMVLVKKADISVCRLFKGGSEQNVSSTRPTQALF